MRTALYKQAPSVKAADCPVRHIQGIDWRQDLPLTVRECVVPPIRFEVLQEYEIAADRTQGYDQSQSPCYCAFRYVVTQIRSDDDEVFYEVPVYAETLTSWRLLDARWLVCRTRISNFDSGERQTFFSLSSAMPR